MMTDDRDHLKELLWSLRDILPVMAKCIYGDGDEEDFISAIDDLEWATKSLADWRDERLKEEIKDVI